jgi:hypothetical protein
MAFALGGRRRFESAAASASALNMPSANIRR